jgi:2-hydroxycyclohexanecarboxyl-CoA dehydrogenase
MERKVALVTGAAAGIGAASAVRLARDGFAVGVLDLDEARCAATVDKILGAGGVAMALGADISDPEQVAAALAKLRAAYGPIAVLVNNAGIPGFAPFLETKLEDWERLLRINLTGTFVVTQQVLPDMVAASYGRIINISSSAGQTGAQNMAGYSASKGGMIALTKTLALEFGPLGITSNVIPPRFITGTIMSDQSFASANQPLSRDAAVQAGPIRREGKPDDIAGTVSWLASEDSGFVTGQVIGVNGGRTIV